MNRRPFRRMFPSDTSRLPPLMHDGFGAMIAAIDVAYRDRGSARAAAVVFEHFSDTVARAEYTADISQVERYVPGAFFRRELPCIMSVIEMIHEPISIVIIDGYVTLGMRPGLGFHLWQQLGQRIAVIGVAKSPFAGSRSIAVIRGLSRNPIYVTSAGMEAALAAEKIRGMHGDYRIPTLLKHADTLSRGIVQEDGSRRGRVSGMLKHRDWKRDPSD